MSTVQQARVLFQPIRTPLQCPGLLLWLDASQITEFGNGVGISTWRDMSGNNRNVIQNTADYQPTLQTGVLNNLSAVKFDGNDYLQHPSATLALKQFSAFFVVRELSHSDYAGIFVAQPSSGNDYNAADGLSCDTGTGSFEIDFRDNLSVATSAISNWHIYSAQKSIGYKSDIRVDGATEVAAQAIGTEPADNSGGGILIAGRWGGGLNPSYRLNGYVAEIIYSSIALSNEDRKSVELYLGVKYGIAVK